MAAAARKQVHHTCLRIPLLPSRLRSRSGLSTAHKVHMSSTLSLSAGSPADPSSPYLSRKDVQTLGLSALGGTLEFYDFVIYVFFAAVLGKLFFPVDMPDWLRQLQTFGIFAAGYLSRPLGGIIIAHFGDKLGRKRMFTLSIFMMAVPTLVIGLLPTYANIGVAAPLLLLAMRVLQGAAIGGEMPGAWVFVAEHVPAKRYGLGVGTLTAGITGGILLGSLVAMAINRHYSPADVGDFAWRIPFILGGVFGLISVYLRRFLHETPVFKELAKRRTVASELPIKTILREHRAACVLVGLLTWVLSAAIVVVVLITPTYLQKVPGAGSQCRGYADADPGLRADGLGQRPLRHPAGDAGWFWWAGGHVLPVLHRLAGHTHLVGVELRPGGPVRRIHRLGADRWCSRFPGGGAFLGPLVCVQHVVRDLRGVNTDRHHAVAAEGPVGASALRGSLGGPGLRARPGTVVQPRLPEKTSLIPSFHWRANSGLHVNPNKNGPCEGRF
jgi:MFS family permease